jgi:hypothetical protein
MDEHIEHRSVTVRMHKSNLIQALNVAIAAQVAVEKEKGFSVDSVFVMGMREILDEAIKGSNIQIR